MPDGEPLEGIITRRRRNGALAWLLILFVGFVVAASAVTENWLWAGFAAAVAVLALLPAIAYRDHRVMLPWEVLALAALPLIGRTFATVPLTSRFATYLAVAALALIIAVELQLFTPVLMTPSFAVLFVVVGTMATAGVWAVVRWGFDLLFGTGFLLDPTLSEHAIESGLMWEFVFSTAAGIAAGIIFEVYFRRLARIDDRLPDEIEVTRP